MKLQSPVLVATGNAGKLAEFRELLAPLGVEVISPVTAGWVPDVDEVGVTLMENALLKARAGAQATGIATLADDSGLFVNALDGAPGVESARYAGPEQDPAANCAKLLGALEGVLLPDRVAEFNCVIALVSTDGEEKVFSGTCRGKIGGTPRGGQGFGYDPLFVSGNGRTFAEMSSAEKHRISHRGRAMQALRVYLDRAGEGNHV